MLRLLRMVGRLFRGSVMRRHRWILSLAFLDVLQLQRKAPPSATSLQPWFSLAQQCYIPNAMMQ